MTDPQAPVALLLRGVNVGGRNRLAMADLRALLERLGCTDVRTYLQSGNAVVVPPPGAGDLAGLVEAGVEALMGRPVTVLARTGPELADALAASPFPPEDPTKVHLAFLASQAPPLTADPATYAPDGLVLGDRVAYLWYPEGAGRAKLTGALLDRALGRVVATARNLRTVTELVRLTGATPPPP